MKVQEIGTFHQNCKKTLYLNILCGIIIMKGEILSVCRHIKAVLDADQGKHSVTFVAFIGFAKRCKCENTCAGYGPG